MPMQQLCGAGCDGQLHYGGSSRPSNILFPGLGYNTTSPMHYVRTGGGPSSGGGDASRSTARYGLGGGGCGAFSASMAQLASPMQCSSRTKQQPHAVIGGSNSSSSSHRLYSSPSTIHCSSSFHGPYAGSSGLPRGSGGGGGPSPQQLFGSCGVLLHNNNGAGGGIAVAAGSLYCNSTILGSTALSSSSRRGTSGTNSVLPPQSHSHQIAKQLEQQQFEVKEAAAGARGACVSHGHYQYHFGRHHSDGESHYSHLFPEKLHDWVEVIKHPRSHSTQATPIALSNLHIGECPGVPENASSFAMKRTGTLKWQPGSLREEDDDGNDGALLYNHNSQDRSDSSKNTSRSSSKSSNRTKNGNKGSKNSNSKSSTSSSGNNSFGLPTKARYHLSHRHHQQQESKNETAGVVPALAAGFIDELTTKTDTTASGERSASVHGEMPTSSLSTAGDAEKIRRRGRGRDMGLSGIFTAAAVVALPAGGTRATTTGTRGSVKEEIRRVAACTTVQKAGEESTNDEKAEEMRGKRRKTLGFRKTANAVNSRKAAGGTRVHRYHQGGTHVMPDDWAVVAETTHCAPVTDGERATTAASSSSSSSGNSSGGSGGESDNSASMLMISSPSYDSALNCLSGSKSDCSGSPRKHHSESVVEDAARAESGASSAAGVGGGGGTETLKRSFSWHKLRQKLKL